MTKHFCTVLRTMMPLVLSLMGIKAIAAPAAAAVPELGIWVDDTGQGAVEIYVCADRKDRLCGRIVWLNDPLNAEGVPKHDRYNPNPSMKNRPICGLPVLGNLARMDEGGFDGGWIYDPKVGKSYTAAINASRDQLTVTGYLGVKFMGKSFVWTRASGEVARCNATVNPAAAGPTPGNGAAAPAAKPAAAQAAKKPATGSPAPASRPATEADAAR